MKDDPMDDGRGTVPAQRRLEEFFRDELRVAVAEAPSFEDLAAYVEGRLDPEARALLEERLAADATLRQEVEDLRELQAQMSRPAGAAVRRFPWRPALLAAAAALVAVGFWLRPGDGARPAPPASATPAVVASVADGGLRLALAADGTLSGLPALDGRTRAAIASALRGTLPAPHGLEPLQPGPAALLGPAAAAAFVLQAPLGTRVSTDRPTFRWTAHPGARSYEVAVFDQDLARQMASGPVRATEWTATRALPRGRTYLWQVTALTGSTRVTAPAPPAPEARFEVAGPAVLADAARFRAPLPASHLLAALAFVESGLLDEADAELRALAAENAGSPEVARLRDRLLGLRAAKPQPTR